MIDLAVNLLIIESTKRGRRVLPECLLHRDEARSHLARVTEQQ